MSAQALSSVQGVGNELQYLRDIMQDLDNRVTGVEKKRNAFRGVLDSAQIVFC
jgi:hypothetical protein